MPGTTLWLPSSWGWACIVCIVFFCDRRHYHLKRYLMVWTFVKSFSFPQGIQAEPVETVKYSKSTHYASFQAIANDSVVLLRVSESVSVRLPFFSFFLIQAEEFPSLTNLYFNAITPSSWLSTLQKTSTWWRPPGPLAALIIVVVSL